MADGDVVKSGLAHDGVKINLQKGEGSQAKVDLYYASVTPSLPTKKAQQYIAFLLDGKKVTYSKHDVTTMDPEDREDMWDASGTKRLPQLFINDKYIGGYDEVLALEEESRLGGMLGCT
eukprot:TRINITY_DN6661_c0_g2_i1.p1 TRINITY_DN6661_c0_g2~~TRINITY_DN6661_c0_g2_i1.p1  ORF type:complete len:119 (-),score=29.81 TRINITY_DN6661_c0_g2_i1:84-440(-)